MVKQRVLTGLVAGIVAAFIALLVGSAAASSASAASSGAGSGAKSFSLESLATTAVVRADGDMEVTEVWVYRFDGGPFNFGIRSFERNTSQIVDFTARDDEGPLVVIHPGQSVSGDWEWALRQPTSDATVTYTLTYRVDGALRVGADVADLNWQFIGTVHPGIGRVDVAVTFPPGIEPASPDVDDADTSVLRGFAHGPSNGVIEVEPSRLVATIERLPAGRFVEIRGIAPAGAFTVSGTEQLLPDILEQERSIAEEGDPRIPQDRTALGWIFTPILAGLGAGGTGLLWFIGGRERRSTEVLGDYWREPLDERPAVALANLHRGTVQAGATVAGTLVDLAQRGYVRIVGEREERLGPDKTVHRYHWLGKPFGPDVVQYERDLLEMVFRGTTETTSDDVDQWARTHQTEAKRLLDEVTQGVDAEYDTLHFEQRPHGARMAILVGICIVVSLAGYVLKRISDNGVAWVAVAAGPVLFALGSRLLMNRTHAGVEAAAKANGLKRYLKNFSQLDEAPVGHLILWERYLVYAVALGVSAELVRGLATRVPAVVNDPNFGVWYRGPYGRFDGFDQIETRGSSMVSASTPNRSGSGGGFSGGGGSSGGGGGGGAGAR